MKKLVTLLAAAVLIAGPVSACADSRCETTSVAGPFSEKGGGGGGGGHGGGGEGGGGGGHGVESGGGGHGEGESAGGGGGGRSSGGEGESVPGPFGGGAWFPWTAHDNCHKQ